MAEKRPPLPLMLTAQDLRGGGVVYWDGAGWVERVEDGLVARDEPAAAALATAQADAAPGQVLDVFLFSVRPDGDPVPAHFRERQRVIGPSFRDDFGRTPPGADRVPL